jgi:regulation of enolase protein 1 (concanavalin A-like superfamily)
VAAGSYIVKAVARDSDGASTSSATAAVTVTSPVVLPDGQQHQDIGGPAIAGSVEYTGDSYTIRAAGVDIWGTNDQFHFVYQPFTGDVDIAARVVSLDAVDPWSKAGVMIRETLTDNSAHVFAHPTPANGYRLTRRLTTSGISSSTAVASGGPPPGWVRLTRRGNVVAMYRSTDGATWDLYDSIQSSMAATVYVGLAVTSHNASVATTAVLDNVSVTAPADVPPAVTLTAPANGAAFTAPATITLTANAADPENQLTRVDFFAGATLLGSDTTPPYSFSWTAVPAGTYVLTAKAVDAAGNQTQSAAVTVSVGIAPPPPLRFIVAFTASTDHDTSVTSYRLDVFAAGADPNTATPLTSSDLGKPTPDGAREIQVDRSPLLAGLAPATYVITVSAIGPGGVGRSVPYTFVR